MRGGRLLNWVLPLAAVLAWSLAGADDAAAASCAYTGGAVLSTWADDPWARAAYSTSPPASVAEAVEEPTGPLAFAGEHTAGPHAALMEGAIRSGRRAAHSLMRRTQA